MKLDLDVPQEANLADMTKNDCQLQELRLSPFENYVWLLKLYTFCVFVGLKIKYCKIQSWHPFLGLIYLMRYCLIQIVIFCIFI